MEYGKISRRGDGNQSLGKAGDKDVLLLISGGVDSTVVAALLLKALPPEKVYLMYIDTGLMRKNETEEVRETCLLSALEDITIADASYKFSGSPLQGG